MLHLGSQSTWPLRAAQRLALEAVPNETRPMQHLESGVCAAMLSRPSGVQHIFGSIEGGSSQSCPVRLGLACLHGLGLGMRARTWNAFQAHTLVCGCPLTKLTIPLHPFTAHITCWGTSWEVCTHAIS